MRSPINPTLGKDSGREEEEERFLDPLDQNKDGDDGNADTRQTMEELFRENLPSVYARRGLLWLSVAIVFQAAQIITMTKLSKKSGVSQALFFRSVFLLTTVVGVSWRESESYHFSDIIIITLSAFFDVIFISCTAFAGMFIWVGDVTSISLNGQIPCALLACIFLEEALDVFDGLFIVLNAIGVIFVAQPSFFFQKSQQFATTSYSSLCGFLLAFVSLAGSVGNVLLYRTLVYRKTNDALLLSTLGGMIGLLFSCVASSVTSSWEFPVSLEEWLTSIAVGVFTLLVFIPSVKALETENVKTVTVMMTMVIPLTTLYDVIILGRDPNWASIGGVLLILGSSFALHIKTT